MGQPFCKRFIIMQDQQVATALQMNYFCYSNQQLQVAALRGSSDKALSIVWQAEHCSESTQLACQHQQLIVIVPSWQAFQQQRMQARICDWFTAADRT